MKQVVIQGAAQAPRPLDVGGFQITVLASTDQTDGYELFRIRGPEGSGPGPHHHPWDESFFVLGGSVHCGVGEFFSITSQGNASRMFQAFGAGINWADPDRRALMSLAASYGQTVGFP